MKLKDKPPEDFFRSAKVPLQHVLKHPVINSPKITNAVIRAHKIVIHALQFMKLYLLHHYNENGSLPIIDKTFITYCMKIVCEEKAVGRPPKTENRELKDKLKSFYNEHYKPLAQNENFDYIQEDFSDDKQIIDCFKTYGLYIFEN